MLKRALNRCYPRSIPSEVTAAIHSMLKRALNRDGVAGGGMLNSAAIHSMLKRALNQDTARRMRSAGRRAAIHSMLKRALNLSPGVTLLQDGVGGNPLDAQAGIESGQRAACGSRSFAAIHSMLKRALNPLLEASP